MKESDKLLRNRFGGGDKKAGATDKNKKSDDKPETKKKAPFAGRYNPKLSDCGSFVPHKVLGRLVIILGALVFVWWHSSGKEKILPIARVAEVIDKKKYLNLQCSPSYKKEIEALDPVCLPSRCGRFVMDNLVTEREAHSLLDLAKKGLAMGGGSGGASILDLHSGALSQGDHFVNLYKSRPGLFNQRDFSVYKEVKDRVKKAIAEHFNIDNDRLYLTHPTFFSELTSVPAVTAHDEYWHPHIDKETYPTFHFTSLLYLADYKKDFTGGRFVFIDVGDKVNRTIEPKEGRVSAFTSDMNRHFVEPVSGGSRYALTMGFTCDKTKEIQDPGTNL